MYAVHIQLSRNSKIPRSCDLNLKIISTCSMLKEGRKVNSLHNFWFLISLRRADNSSLKISAFNEFINMPRCSYKWDAEAAGYQATPITFKWGCTSIQEIYSNPLLLDTLFLKVWVPLLATQQETPFTLQVVWGMQNV